MLLNNLSWEERGLTINIDNKSKRWVLLEKNINSILQREKISDIDKRIAYISSYFILTLSFNLNNNKPLLERLDEATGDVYRKETSFYKIILKDITSEGNNTIFRILKFLDESILLSLSSNAQNFHIYSKADIEIISKNLKENQYYIDDITLNLPKYRETNSSAIRSHFNEYLSTIDNFLDSIFNIHLELLYIFNNNDNLIDITPEIGLAKKVFSIKNFNNLYLMNSLLSSYISLNLDSARKRVDFIPNMEFMQTLSVLLTEGGIYSNINKAYEAALLL